MRPVRLPRQGGRTMRCLASAVLMLGWGLMAVLPAFAQPPPAEPDVVEQPPAEEELESLIRVLEDEEARTRLIQRLREAAVEVPTEEAPFLLSAQETLARELAEYTREVGAQAAGIVSSFVELVDEIAALAAGDVPVDWQAVSIMAWNVALVVAATFGAYLLLQIGFALVQRRLAAAAAVGGLPTRVRTVLTSILLDAASVAAAWGVGMGSALAIGAVGEVGVNQSLFLNAFLIVELTKVAARAVLAPRWPALQVWRMDPTGAAYWYFWLSRLVSFVGYTFLFVAPVLAAFVTLAVAEAVRVLVLLTALVIASAIILQCRDSVRRGLKRRVQAGRNDSLSRLMASMAGLWHVAAIGYLVLVYVLWLADDETALPFVLDATARSAVAVALGLLLSGFVAHVASGGMRLSPDLKERLPLLEQRLNAFVPNVLRVVRIVIAVGVVLAILQMWGVINLAGWLGTDVGQRVLTSVLSAAAILLVGLVAHIAVQSWVEYRLNPHYGSMLTARERTLLALFRNGFTIVVAAMVVMLVLAQLGVNIGPLLAGAGVVGLAVGFGAQKLVQDIINGVFIQFENTMNEGDVVTAGGITGVVERLTIRSVSLRSLDGTYHVVPFSSVDSVSNLMKYFSYHVAAIGVAYRESIPEVKQAMVDAFEQLKGEEIGADIIDELDMQGVIEFGASAVVVRARIKTVPGRQWVIGRRYNEIVKEIFDDRDIEIPFPHMTLYMGQGKDGQAAPMRIESVEAPRLQAQGNRNNKKSKKKKVRAGARGSGGAEAEDEDEDERAEGVKAAGRHRD